MAPRGSKHISQQTGCATVSEIKTHLLFYAGTHAIVGTSLQQAEITGEVLTARFSSLTAVVHSASYPPGDRGRIE